MKGMTQIMSISVLLLSYNEEENLKILIPKIKNELNKLNEIYGILAIDSAVPTDNTKEVCKEFEADYIPQEEPFYAGAFKTGIKYAEKDKILVLDADASHNPKNIKDIYGKFIEDYDIVIESRYVSSGKTNDKKSSIIMSRIFNGIMRPCIGVKAKDISTSYRMYDTKQLKAIQIKTKNYEVLQEIILRMKKNNKNLKIGEIPIKFDKRMFGESKRKLFKFICGYIVSVFNFLFIRIGIKD